MGNTEETVRQIFRDILATLQGTLSVSASLDTTGLATEAKQDDIITALGTIDGRVDGLETLVGTTNSTLTTIDGHVDGIEGLLTTIDADTGNIDTSLNAIERYIAGPAAGTAVDSYTHAAINLAAGANQSIVSAPGASKQIWVYGIFGVMSAAGTWSLQDEDDTALSGVIPFAANSGPAMPPSGNFAMPLFKVATNKALEIDLSGADFDGWIDYAVVSV